MNISSTDQDHGLCYFFMVEVESRVDAGIIESV